MSGERDYLSFKIESQKLPELPLPRPLFEVFVFSTRMEGIHLRMGLVARGGIRWSDRRGRHVVACTRAVHLLTDTSWRRA